jgi:hypothetical protein
LALKLQSSDQPLMQVDQLRILAVILDTFEVEQEVQSKLVRLLDPLKVNLCLKVMLHYSLD